MLKIFFFLLLFLLPVVDSPVGHVAPPAVVVVSECEQLYSDMQLENVINYTAFEQVYRGYNTLPEIKNRDIVTLIDFTKPSTDERFFVLDFRHRKLLYTSVVSHGRNSGDNFATSFSNEIGSLKSSLGFFLTEATYGGKNGYSLILEGLEKGINDQARARAIVIHGASYSDPSVIRYAGRLGRSLGCPALPPAVSKTIIDTIKGGTLLYIYADNSDYKRQSPVLSNYASLQ